MEEKLTELAGAADDPLAAGGGWHELAVANPTFLLEVGELVAGLIASLVAAGWAGHDAREANIPNLIGAGG